MLVERASCGWGPSPLQSDGWPAGQAAWCEHRAQAWQRGVNTGLSLALTVVWQILLLSGPVGLFDWTRSSAPPRSSSPFPYVEGLSSCSPPCVLRSKPSSGLASLPAPTPLLVSTQNSTSQKLAAAADFTSSPPTPSPAPTV